MFVPLWVVVAIVSLVAFLLWVVGLFGELCRAARRDAREWERDARFWHRYATGTRAPAPVSVEVLREFSPPVVVFSVLER